MHPVAFGGVAAGHAADFKRNDLAIQHTDDALQRANPAHVSGAPAHGFGPVEFADDAGHSLGDHVFRVPARHGGIGNVEVALLGFGHDFRFADVFQPCPAQEAGDGLFRRADLGAFLLFAHIGRARVQPLNHGGEAARAGDGKGVFPAKARFFQLAREGRQKVSLSLRLHARGDFFGEEFDQEFGHGFSQLRASSCSAH